MTTKTYICEKPDCAKPFTAKKADRRRGWARFCSKSCAAWVREKNLDRKDYYGRKPRQEDIANGGYDEHFDKHGVVEHG